MEFGTRLPMRGDPGYLGDPVLVGGPPRSHLVTPVQPAPAGSLQALEQRVRLLEARIVQLEARPLWQPWRVVWRGRLQRGWTLLQAWLARLRREERG